MNKQLIEIFDAVDFFAGLGLALAALVCLAAAFVMPSAAAGVCGLAMAAWAYALIRKSTGPCRG